MTFCTLLYMDGPGAELTERQWLFVRNAQTLARTLSLAGHQLLVFANDHPGLHRALAEAELAVRVLKFQLTLPPGIRYPEAHRKWELFQYLGQTNDDYWILLDSDMVVQSSFPDEFYAIVSAGEPLLINVTFDTLPAHNRGTIVQALRLLNPAVNAGEWFGGEFIGGTPGFFQDLSTEIQKRLPLYWQHWDDLFHQGDEMVTNAALDVLAHRWPLRDAGNLGFVVRYFSATPKHFQRPIEAYRDVAFWHLPSDKRWLAGLRVNSAEEILPLYQKELRRVRAPHPIEDLVNGLKRVWGRLKTGLGLGGS